jgi:hypothetical protein
VKVISYPHYPEKNVITLSTTTPKLTAKLQEIESEIEEFDGKIESSTSWLTDSDGGKIYFIRDNDGNITSQVLKVGDGNNPPVWVFNKNGIGYSPDGISGTPSVAITANGEIVADKIKTGIISDALGNSTINMANGAANMLDLKAKRSLQLVDSNNQMRGSLSYSINKGTSLYILNSDRVPVATVQQISGGGIVAVGMNDGAQVGTLVVNDNGGALALSNKNNTHSVQLTTGNDYSGIINVFDDIDNVTINMSGNSGRVTCVSVTQTSSRDVKTNIRPITDAKKILELDAVSFDYKDKTWGEDKRGFIAEDVELILPNLINAKTDTTPATLDYISMIPYLQSIVKDQEKRIRMLEGLT